MHGLIIRITLFSALMLVSAKVPGQETISLNGDWQFRLARSGKEARDLEGFQNVDFKAKGFCTIPVPSNWAVLGYEEPVYGYTSSAVNSCRWS